MNEEFNCDLCGEVINYPADEVYHFTVVKDGEINPHFHVCHQCTTNHFMTSILDVSDLIKASEPSFSKDFKLTY